MKKQNYTWYLIILIGIVIVIFILISKKQQYAPSATPENTTSYPRSTTLNYTQAVNQYINKRIQFDDVCQAIPNSITVKNGASIMLDNRFSEQRFVTLDNRKYTLTAHGFQIITLSSRILPHVVAIDCGGPKSSNQIYINVAQILIQR